MKTLNFLINLIFFAVISFIVLFPVAICYSVVTAPAVDPINAMVALGFGAFMLFIWVFVGVLVFQTDDWLI